MPRNYALASLVLFLAACKVTVLPAVDKPATPVVVAASAKPGAATPKPKPTSGAAGADEGERIDAGVIDGLTLPERALAGEEVQLTAKVVLNDGCTSFHDAKADVDQAAKRVTVSARVKRGPADMGCTMALGSYQAKLAFTPESAGTWTIVAKGYGDKVAEEPLEVGQAGASPKPTDAPGEEGWTSTPLSFSRVTPPTAAKAGVATAIGFEAGIGSSTCSRFEAAAAEVDAATKTVRLAGTRRTAPAGTACTKDFRSHEGEAAVTLPTAGTWTLSAPGAKDTAFEVAP